MTQNTNHLEENFWCCQLSNVVLGIVNCIVGLLISYLHISDMRGFSVTRARVLAGVAGAGACFVAGGLAQEKLQQLRVERPLVTSARESLTSSAPFSSLLAQEAGRERSFIMIKPDGVQRGLVGEIIKR